MFRRVFRRRAKIAPPVTLTAAAGQRFKQGQRARASTAVTNDKTGLPFDPATNVFRFKDSKGAVTVIEAARAAAGAYEALITLLLAGTWWFRYEGRDESGELVAVDEGPIEVEKTHF